MALMFISAVCFPLVALLGYCILGVHEWGHYWAVRKCRLPIRSVQVLNLRFEHSNGKWLGTHYYSNDFLGLVTFDDTMATHKNMRFVAIAGPMANFACALILLPLAIYFGMMSVPSALAASHFFTGVANLIPFKTKAGFFSDGLLFLKHLETLDKK